MGFPVSHVPVYGSRSRYLTILWRQFSTHVDVVGCCSVNLCWERIYFMGVGCVCLHSYSQLVSITWSHTALDLLYSRVFRMCRPIIRYGF